MTKREAERKEKKAVREAEEAKRKEEEVAERAKNLAEFNSFRDRFGAPLASVLPHYPQQVDLETLKAIAHNVWLDEEYGKAFREDTEWGGAWLLTFFVTPLSLTLLRTVRNYLSTCPPFEQLPPDAA